MMEILPAEPSLNNDSNRNGKCLPRRMPRSSMRIPALGSVTFGIVPDFVLFMATRRRSPPRGVGKSPRPPSLDGGVVGFSPCPSRRLRNHVVFFGMRRPSPPVVPTSLKHKGNFASPRGALSRDLNCVGGLNFSGAVKIGP